MNLESIKGKILVGFPKKRNYLACFPSEDVERKVKVPICFSTKNTNKAVFKRIFILDRIEYRILIVLAKLTKSNNEYYSCCEIYSNNIRIVPDIQIFEYF